MSRSLADVLAIYEGSSGDATKALYVDLEKLGPAGIVAVNVFRASKTSGRAKVYRGRRYKGAAYDTKQWSIENLVKVLNEHASSLGIRWGWKIDPSQEFHKWVFYIDLPLMRGQLSFHTAERGDGPDYPGQWDGIRNVGPQRICRWVTDLLAAWVSA